MYWIEHADTFSYEYSVVAECETREEAEEIRDWYQARTGAMSVYRIVDRYSDLRGTPYRELLDMLAEMRRDEMAKERPLRPEEV